MRAINKLKISRLKRKYKKGDKVKLIRMNEFQAKAPGSIGTIMSIEENTGAINVEWDDGGSMPLLPNKDVFELLD